MRVGIATVQVPFVRGGAEMLAENLAAQVRAAGHEAEIISIPFKWYPPRRIPEAMAVCRMLDLTESSGTRIDRLVGLKFPAYMIPHPNKILWLLHQHRGAYELWDTPLSDLRGAPDGQHVRALIHGADRRMIPEARACYTISRTVTNRLQEYCGLPSTPIYHPPPGAPAFGALQPRWGDFFLMPSRINATKRQSLVLDAMERTRNPVRVVFAGAADDPGTHAALQAQSAGPRLRDRVTWLGNIAEAEKLRLYEGCRAVVFPPVDEDYGYVTLEAMLASKAVVTCTDSGGPLEFVTDGVNGLVCDPSPDALAQGLDRLWEDQAAAREYGRAGRARYADMGIGWEAVLGCLLD